MQREKALESWLAGLFPGTPLGIAPASSDASFRRYFRVQLPEGTRIVMDAPPEHEDCGPFIRIAAMLGDAGVNVPRVLAQDTAQGFLLLTDLGPRTWLDVLDERNADAAYGEAFAALVRMQHIPAASALPPYDAALLDREMALFPEWYVGRHLGATLLPAESEALARATTILRERALAQSQVFVHRDYHSRNLMWSDPNPGVLDFQDAVVGPITYDAVSLLKDAYVEWPEARVLDWLIRYWQRARADGLPVQADFSEFHRDFEFMGMQRHLKVLGIFARLYHRDGKDGYLGNLPLVLSYLRRACARYRDFQPLTRLLDRLHATEHTTGYTF